MIESPRSHTPRGNPDVLVPPFPVIRYPPATVIKQMGRTRAFSAPGGPGKSAESVYRRLGPAYNKRRRRPGPGLAGGCPPLLGELRHDQFLVSGLQKSPAPAGRPAGHQ